MRHLGLLLSFCCVLANTETFLMAQERTPLTVTRLYSGTDGLSHFERIRVKFVSVPGEPTAVAESEPVITSKSYFVRCAPGFFSDWHNADARRYVITISGRAEVEVAGAEKFMAQPGEIVLAEDLTGKGHTFRVLGDNDWVAVFVDMGK
jgi:quercetin dioxygenase-like cupin family protein